MVPEKLEKQVPLFEKPEIGIVICDTLFFNDAHTLKQLYLFVRLGYSWHLVYVDEVLAKRRVHGKSWTWSRSELFPTERRVMLRKLREWIPDFELSYAKEVNSIERACAWEEAQLAWRRKKKREALQLLQPYRTSGLKWFGTYYLTWFPYVSFGFCVDWRG